MQKEKDGIIYHQWGELEGCRIYTAYASEGPDLEETIALYQAAREDSLYRELAELAGREEGQ